MPWRRLDALFRCLLIKEKYFLKCADIFVGWMETYNGQTEKAQEGPQGPNKQSHSSCGFPKYLQSDNGPSFISFFKRTISILFYYN